MIALRIKEIINKSNIKSLLFLDDENNLITSRCFKIRLLNEINGDVEFYLFNHVFYGKVFFNSLDSCYIELNENQKLSYISLNDINSYEGMNTDFSILNFFHIRGINMKPFISIYNN